MVAEAMSVLAICLAFLTIGLNTAFIVSVKRYSLFPLPTVLFLLGKSLLNVYIILSLWDNVHVLTWRSPLALVNYIVVAASLYYLRKRAAHVDLHLPEIVAEHPEVVAEAGCNEWDETERREENGEECT